MQNPLKRPNYNELVELSNGDLTKRIRTARDVVNKALREHQPTTEKENIWQDFEDERLKRLKLAKGTLLNLPNGRSKRVSCRLTVNGR